MNPRRGRGAALVLLLAPAAALAQAAAPAASEDGSPTPPFFDVNKFRADPSSPGAIRVPGTNVAIYVGGFAQLDAIYDANVIGTADKFDVSSIPVGGGTGDTGSQLSARQSRVFVETDAPWSVAPLLAYIELDFFDPQNQSDFHIRHAFGAVGHPGGVRFVGGQTWTTFMDANILPSQLDYAGPVGIANVIQPQARLIVPIRGGFQWTVALEAPGPQITVPMGTQATSYARWPDLTTAFRWDHDHGHLLVSGVFRQLGILPASGSREATVGCGGTLTGRLTGFWGKDQLLWSVGAGRGIAAYFPGSSGLDLDAFLQPNGTLSAPSLLAAMGSYQHYLWRDRLAINAIYSLLHLYHLGAGTDATLEQVQYVGGVLQVFPNKRFMTGVEYLFGERENRNGQIGRDNRVQVSTQVTF